MSDEQNPWGKFNEQDAERRDFLADLTQRISRPTDLSDQDQREILRILIAKLRENRLTVSKVLLRDHREWSEAEAAIAKAASFGMLALAHSPWLRLDAPHPAVVRAIKTITERREWFTALSVKDAEEPLTPQERVGLAVLATTCLKLIEQQG